jgi:short-subunit dehydrogenase
MTRRSLRGSRAVVTGASGGIGREVAVELARRGATLLITARRAELLTETREAIKENGSEAAVVIGDITSHETRQQIHDVANEQWGAIDILINNAGVGARGPFVEASADRLRRIMEVNFFAPVELIRDTLPLLSVGRAPMIVNVSSVLGHRAVPNKSEYCASKFALHGFSDSLRAELASFGVDVLLVSPSTTDSEFSEHVLENRVATKSFGRGMSPVAVARRTVRAIERGRHEVVLSFGGRLLVWVDRLCPPLADWLVAKFG